LRRRLALNAWSLGHYDDIGGAQARAARLELQAEQLGAMTIVEDLLP
jgi:hypothetical protein